MGGRAVADPAVFGGSQPAAIVAPAAVAALGPVSPVSAGSGLIMAAHAVVLAVAVKAAVAVRASGKPMAPGAPEPLVVPRLYGRMALGAVVPAMAGVACATALPGPADIYINRTPVITEPVSLVAVGHRDWDPAPLLGP